MNLNKYIYIYISSILIYIQTFTSYNKYIAPLASPSSPPGGAIYIYIYIYSSDTNPL